MVPVILLILITIFIPPLGVFLVRGCGADLLINICLTILGYLPGHVHAFYIEYVEIKKKEARVSGGVYGGAGGYAQGGEGYSQSAGVYGGQGAAGGAVGGPRGGYAQQGGYQQGQVPVQGQAYGTTGGKT